jgi:hypothetical protein
MVIGLVKSDSLLLEILNTLHSPLIIAASFLGRTYYYKFCVCSIVGYKSNVSHSRHVCVDLQTVFPTAIFRKTLTFHLNCT